MVAPSCADHRAVEEALARAAAFGPYFTAHRDSSRLALSARKFMQGDQLRLALVAVGAEIGTRETRVAASTLQYGLAARLWSLVLGVWRCGGVVLDLRGLSYVVTAAGSVSPVLADPRAWDSSSLATDEVAELIASSVIGQQLADFHVALHAVVPVADGLLWGNAASALVSAARAVTAKQPGEQFGAVIAALLSREPLTGRLVSTADGRVRRRSCCLWYRTRHRDSCGDCPLTGRPVTR